MRIYTEKVGYIYYLQPKETLECTSLNTHKDGLICSSQDDAIYSISYKDFSRLLISFIPR